MDAPDVIAVRRLRCAGARWLGHHSWRDLQARDEAGGSSCWIPVGCCPR